MRALVPSTFWLCIFPGLRSAGLHYENRIPSTSCATQIRRARRCGHFLNRDSKASYPWTHQRNRRYTPTIFHRQIAQYYGANLCLVAAFYTRILLLLPTSLIDASDWRHNFSRAQHCPYFSSRLFFHAIDGEPHENHAFGLLSLHFTASA